MSQPALWGCPRAADAPQTRSQLTDRIDDSLDALLAAHNGSARPAYAITGTVWRQSTTGQLFLYNGTTDLPIAVKVAVPTTATDPGEVGQFAVDGSFAYFCIAQNTWVRAAVATW